MPGLNGTDGLFQDFIKHSPQNFETIALTYPTNEKLTYDELTDRVCRILADLRGPIVLVGESFSGPLSLFVTAKSPANIIAVALVATFIHPPIPAFLKVLPWSVGFTLAKPFYAIRAWLPGKSKAAAILRAAAWEMRKVQPAVLAHRVRQALTVNAANALATCPSPILYLQAENDLLVPKSALRKILSAKKSIKVVVLPTHHFLLQSLPAAAWSAISEFIHDLPTLNSRETRPYDRDDLSRDA